MKFVEFCGECGDDKTPSEGGEGNPAPAEPAPEEAPTA